MIQFLKPIIFKLEDVNDFYELKQCQKYQWIVKRIVWTNRKTAFYYAIINQRSQSFAHARVIVAMEASCYKKTLWRRFSSDFNDVALIWYNKSPKNTNHFFRNLRQSFWKKGTLI